MIVFTNRQGFFKKIWCCSKIQKALHITVKYPVMDSKLSTVTGCSGSSDFDMWPSFPSNVTTPSVFHFQTSLDYQSVQKRQEQLCNKKIRPQVKKKKFAHPLAMGPNFIFFTQNFLFTNPCQTIWNLMKSTITLSWKSQLWKDFECFNEVVECRNATFD